MKKLELHHIAGYLPYGLYGRFKERIVRGNVIGLNTDHYGVIISPAFRDELNNFEPVLRPESDLTKPIRHKGYNNGEEFVPIIEIAKMLFPEAKELKKIGCGNVDITLSDELFSYVLYCQKGSFGLEYGVDGKIIPGHFRIYDLLNQWLIDYRGLIPAGLAKSVYDLKENPYE